jgi:hypothetical protein
MARTVACPLVAMAVLLAACGGGGGKQATPTTTTNPTGRLAGLLITEVPAGFVVPDAVGDTGPSDLAKAARDDGQPDATAALTADGFVAGYQRLWTTAGNGSQIIVFLYQFRTAAGAKAYERRSVTNDASDPQTRVSSFPVASVPGATGLASAAHPTTAIVLFDKGDYLVQLVTGAPSGSRDLAEQLAKQQYDRL